jgi:STAS domain
MSAQPPSSKPGPVVCDVGGLLHPDLRAVEALARLRLRVLRAGRTLELRHARPDLRALIDLLGLAEVLPLRVEVVGQAEQREQVLRVQEERDPREPVA